MFVGGGATGIWWLCNGSQIRAVDPNSLPRKLTHYKTFSMFYCDGKAFSVLRGDATRTEQDEGWLPLCFEHDQDDYSSYLTNAKYEPALYCRRPDQKWVSMLLPDVYHGTTQVTAPYGGLKGELPIFLALIAFSIPIERLTQDLPAMFHTQKWQQYTMANGRTYLSRPPPTPQTTPTNNPPGSHKRGVVVEVYTYSTGAGGSSPADLGALEDNGMYYA